MRRGSARALSWPARGARQALTAAAPRRTRRRTPGETVAPSGVDPERGGIVQRSGKVSRLRRWLYQGFHSLDFPFLYFKRPLWDIVVIVLSIGGTVLSFTTLLPAIRRLRRHGRAVMAWRPMKKFAAAGVIAERAN